MSASVWDGSASSWAALAWHAAASLASIWVAVYVLHRLRGDRKRAQRRALVDDIARQLAEVALVTWQYGDAAEVEIAIFADPVEHERYFEGAFEDVEGPTMDETNASMLRAAQRLLELGVPVRIVLNPSGRWDDAE